MTESATPPSVLEQTDPFPLSRRLMEQGAPQRWEAVQDYAQLILQQMARLEGTPASTCRHFPSPEDASGQVKALAREAGADLILERWAARNQ